jgi:Tfp pilus assembly protein PilN
VLAEVQRFEQRRTQLQQRVSLIEQLRGGQSVPVQLLDHVSRSLPDMMWLTGVDQQKGEMTIEGRSTTLIALSDFVGSLGESNLVQKPIEIVSSQVETMQPLVTGGVSADVIKFTVKAQLAPIPDTTVQPAVATAAGGVR